MRTAADASRRFDDLEIDGPAEALRGVVRRTPLVRVGGASFGALFDDPRIELRLKLENRQETGSFKARGAWNQVRQLSAEERRAGVVTCSSGNHGRALAWAARRAGVSATVVMPSDAYPNKIAACRELGAEVVLCGSREEAEAVAAERVAKGRVLVHPYDARRTVEGAASVGLEIAEDWPEVEVVLVPVGGGGLVTGVSLALQRRLAGRARVFGVEPEGAPTLTRALAAGAPVDVSPIGTAVQGLCPASAGALNVAVCALTLEGTICLSDEAIFEAQRRLVLAGETVEPAGAAAVAAVTAVRLPPALLDGRRDPLRVCAVVSGGNAEPEQLATLGG